METPVKLLTRTEKFVRYQELRHEFQNQALAGLLNPVNDLADRKCALELETALTAAVAELKSVSAWERDLHTSNMIYCLLSGAV